VDIRRKSVAIAALLLPILVIAACSNATNTSANSGGNGGSGNTNGHLTVGAGTPGVTSSQIIVGGLATESGALAGAFGTEQYGVQAYFDYVNAHGGVFGRKINFAYNLDDAGSTTEDTTQARNLVEQDHVFAVVGVGTPFFSAANYFAAVGTPVFGYVVTQDWNNHPNEFGAYGSYLDYTASQPIEAWVAKQLHAKSVAVIAYNIAASSEDACASVEQGLQKQGVHVGFSDLAFPYQGNPTADVLKMKSANVDLYISCIEGSDNLAFAKTMAEYGMGSVKKLWLNGYDRSYLQQSPQDMVGTIYLDQHVPFEAAAQFPGKYPSMEQYLATMRQYEPTHVYDDLSFQGYLNAVQFVTGLEQVQQDHLPLTQANLIDTINKETNFTGGLTTPINWTNAHSSAPPPYCSAFVEVEPGDKLQVVFQQANDEVFVCGNAQGQIISDPAGTPGL
jgi:ABC-type branched-subunit amino acid transport system substrate-binding protein